MAKKVLMVGWHPSVVDYSKFPGLDAGKLEAGLKKEQERLRGLGYDTSIGFIHHGSSAANELIDILNGNNYDVVLIGAGVRKDDEHFLVFEQLVNVVHEHAPGARIAFNTGPADSAAAIQRWA